MTNHETLRPAAHVRAGNVLFANDAPISVLAGPCQMESRAHALEMASALAEIAAKLGFGLVYKSSFDKANRTSLTGRRGMGSMRPAGLCRNSRDARLAGRDRRSRVAQCAAVAEAVESCNSGVPLPSDRPLVAAAKTGRVVKIKKGQFLAPWDMKNVVAKVTGSGNPNVLVTERGVSFGYNTLVVDMRALPQMAETGAPVIFDATHAVQQPGGQGTSSGGDRRFVPVLARAAVAVGVAASSSRRIRIRTRRRRTGRTWCRSRSLPRSLRTPGDRSYRQRTKEREPGLKLAPFFLALRLGRPGAPQSVGVFLPRCERHPSNRIPISSRQRPAIA